MQRHDIVVIGASAGGVAALQTLLSGLPAELPASVFVVIHIPSDIPSMLPEILSRAGPLPCVQAADGEHFRPGTVYVAAPDRHMVFQDGNVRLARGPKENRFRPSVDTLFRSAADAFGPRVIGVILTGGLNDGALGLRAVKKEGGIAIVQDPLEAEFGAMPQSALEWTPVDYKQPVAAIAATIARLADGAGTSLETAPALGADMADEREAGQPTGFTCPECHGSLWELRDGEVVHFRCRVGHGFSASSLVEAQDEDVENAIWAALRALEESAVLSRKLEQDARGRNSARVAERFARKAGEQEKHASVLRRLLD
ncbi:MAG: chemotaxis protein CheB [Acidobacteriota bacterium]